MISVFEQRAGERFADREAMSFAFFLTELSGILKGAYVMWFSKILAFDRRQSSPGVVPAPTMSVEEAKKLREQTIQNMVGAIADHDFVAARRFSDEEERLKHVMEELRDPLLARRKLA
jgi:hypothetical protein